LKKGVIIAGVILALLIWAVAYWYDTIASWREPLSINLRFFTDRAALAAYLKSWGILAPLAFIVVQAFQVIASPIPGEATGLLGGYLFGAGLGFVYSTIGLTLGSIANFAIARWLEVHFVERFIPKQVYHKFDFLTRAEGMVVTFMLFVIPGFPKDYLCYVLGLSPMPWRTFLVVSTLGRMPGTWLLSMQGYHVSAGNYWTFAAVLAGTAVVVYLAHRYRARVHAWAHRLHPPKTRASVPPEAGPEKGQP
jgi:uncharacterized membrane protein YdjX (TVP38/TMEM64 family)